MWVCEYQDAQANGSARKVTYESKALALRNAFHEDGTRIRKVDFDAVKDGDSIYREWYQSYTNEESFYVGDGTQKSKPYMRKVQIRTLRPAKIYEEK
jgi:hypothetical protein